MTWGAVAGAAIGVVGSAMTSDGGGGGGGGQTASKDPWAAAAPWLQSNLASGQALQGQYQANPFSATQQQAYGNQFADSDYFRSLTSSVMGQMNGFQPFDRNNPTARPTMFQFPSRSGSAAGGGMASAPAGSMQATNPFMSAVLTAPPPPPPPAPPAPAPVSSNPYVYDGSTNWSLPWTGSDGF